MTSAPITTSAAIEARDLRLTLGEGDAAVEILRGIDLTVHDGETLALLAALDALVKSAPPAVAEAFARHRLSGLSGRSYGEPIPSQVAETLLERNLAVAR